MVNYYTLIITDAFCFVRFILAIAEVYFLEGDKELEKKDLFNAIYFYTEGIEVNCKDNELNATLYNNRATAYFHSGEILLDSQKPQNHK